MLFCYSRTGGRLRTIKAMRLALTRPGKKNGVSGGYRKQDKLYVFTDATEFEASKAYNPAQVFAVLECGNDMKKARTQLLTMDMVRKFILP